MVRVVAVIMVVVVSVSDGILLPPAIGKTLGSKMIQQGLLLGSLMSKPRQTGPGWWFRKGTIDRV